MTTLALTWRLLHGSGGGPRGTSPTFGRVGPAGLTFAAVAVSTGLLLFALAGNAAFGARAAHDAWRHPVPSAAPARAVQSLSTAYVGHGSDSRPVIRIDVAALRPDAPVPPGAPAFPRPGQSYLSFALAKLADRLPPRDLAERFGHRAGVLGRAALTRPGELVALVGHAPGDLPVRRAPRRAAPGDRYAPPTRVADFHGKPSGDAIGYQALALIASILLAVPLVVFGGAAARLTVARRDRRLAALRLAGATGGQVTAMTVAEAIITGLAGALAGAACYLAALPLLADISLGGGPFFTTDLWVGPMRLAAVVAGVPLLVGASAVTGLHRVIVSPLGVARRRTPPGMRWVRVAVFVAILVGFAAAGRRGTALFLAGFGGSFLALALVGPWVVALLGRMAARTARGPASLLAARRLTDDRRSAWRMVSGVALTGFVAGFMAVANVGDLSPHDAPNGPLHLTVPTASAPHAERAADRRLTAAHIPATVSRHRGLGMDDRHRIIDVSVRRVGDVDAARTVLSGPAPGRTATTAADADQPTRRLLGDLHLGSSIVLAASFLVAIVSAGITAVSGVLDRRQTYTLLRLAGTPLRVLDRTRLIEALLPLSVMGGGAVVTGMFPAVVLGAATHGFSARGLVTLACCLAAGVAGIIGASALSRPLLRAVTADPVPRPD